MGESEAIIGQALKSRRNEYNLATKISSLSWDGYTGRELREQVEGSITESLHALQTDIIDLLYLHNATPELIQRGEIVEIMQRAQQAGYARFIGTTTYGEAAPLAVLKDGHFDCVQVAYNLLDHQFEEQVLPLAKKSDVGVVIRSVLLKGALTHRYVYLPEELRELRTAVNRVNSLRDTQDRSLPELAYRFVLAHPAVSTALVGTGRVHELEEIVSFAGGDPASVQATRQPSRDCRKSRPNQPGHLALSLKAHVKKECNGNRVFGGVGLPKIPTTLRNSPSSMRNTSTVAQ